MFQLSMEDLFRDLITLEIHNNFYMLLLIFSNINMLTCLFCNKINMNFSFQVI